MNPENLKRVEAAGRALITRVYPPCLEAWQHPTPEVCAMLVLGARPKTLAPQLTRKEANAWAYQSECVTPEEWLWSQLSSQYEELADATRPAEVEIIRWVDKICSNPETRKSAARTTSPVLGDEVEGSVWQRLDEIRPQDLTASPWNTIARAVARHVKEQWDGPNELIPPDPKRKFPKGVTRIETFDHLYQEGKTMRHCIATYAKDIAERKCEVFSIRAGDSRSTLCVWRDGSREHRTLANRAPSEECKKLAAMVRGPG